MSNYKGLYGYMKNARKFLPGLCKTFKLECIISEKLTKYRCRGCYKDFFMNEKKIYKYCPNCGEKIIIEQDYIFHSKYFDISKEIQKFNK